AGGDVEAVRVDRRQLVPGRQRDDQIAMTLCRPARRHDQSATRRGARETPRSISPASRILIGLTSTLSDGAAAWMTPNWAGPDVVAGPPYRRTAACVTCGAMCLSSSSHFPLRPYSNDMKPVALPPGRARLSTKPAPTGSPTIGNTIGTVRVACSNGPTFAVPEAKITSGASATNSAAYLRTRSASPPGQR